jgi:hypothetical protein
VLLAAGGVTVHELRYALAYGRDAGHVAAQQGHSYLSIVTPVVALALLLAVVHLVARAAPAGGAGGPPRRRLRSTWLLASASLIAIYGTQEWLEGSLASGHPAGLAGIVGHGGCIALPLAMAVAALIALALRGAAAAVDEHAVAGLWLRWSTVLPDSLAAPTWHRPRLDVLARNLAGRGPPLTSV